MGYRQIKIVILLTAILTGEQLTAQNKVVNRDKTNIVLIVADDLGYGDIGCFGGEINTPNIDKLASSGIKFSHFHTAPMCSPTRAMLMSGNDNHIAGVGAQSFFSPAFGYEGNLTDRVITIPMLLKDAGYHTYMAGKWHLGTDPSVDPYEKGFERSFTLLHGAGNHYTNKSALSAKNSTYTEDGKVTSWNDGDYSTDFYTDKLISYIDSNRDDQRPFFVYAAYTSPHWPLQVEKSYWEKYRGVYDSGYEELRKKRLSTLIENGIIPEDTELPELHSTVKPWDSLTAEEQKRESRKMELYAGMVDNLDYNIGRLVDHLKSIGEYSNTLFVFMSDNGAARRDFINSDKYKHLLDYYNNDYENMGEANSYVSYGPQWAEAGSAPFRYFKDYATEGGTNTTLIMSGPQVNSKSSFDKSFTTVLDLAPTFYDIADISYPTSYGGKKLEYPLRGKSLLPYLSGGDKQIHSSDYVFAIEHYGNAMVRKGDWKITNFIKPFDIKNFKLYNIKEDPSEQFDLKERYADKYDELISEWRAYVKEVKIQHPLPKPTKEDL